jgi:hypothetical protein
MTPITLNEPLSTQLGGVTEPVQILNSQGSPIGHFVPIFKLRPEDNCPYSAEELAEMRADPGGMTLEEFWTSIGAK